MQFFASDRRKPRLRRLWVVACLFMVTFGTGSSLVGQSLQPQQSTPESPYSRQLYGQNFATGSIGDYRFPGGWHGSIRQAAPQGDSGQRISQQGIAGSEMAPPPLSTEAAQSMVDDLQRIRDSSGNSVAGVFQNLVPGEHPDAVFRQELMDLATQPELDRYRNFAPPRQDPYRPLPIRTGQSKVQLAGRYEPAPPVPQPLQPLPVPSPVAATWFDSARDLPVSHQPVQHPGATEDLRRIARILDNAAADLEDIGRFDDADRVRNQAHGLRMSARKTGH